MLTLRERLSSPTTYPLLRFSWIYVYYLYSRTDYRVALLPFAMGYLPPLGKLGLALKEEISRSKVSCQTRLVNYVPLIGILCIQRRRIQWFLGKNSMENGEF